MRYAIFSDIHSNLQALNAVVESYSNEAIDKYFCVGDIVGYAANPRECLNRIKKLNSVTVAGNHDFAVVDLTDIEYFNPVAKEAILWTKAILSAEEKNFFKGLPLVFDAGDFSLVHGTLDAPQDFDYLANESVARSSFNLMKHNLLFVGHTHAAGIFIEQGKGISYSEAAKIKVTSGKRYIVNVGSVGQPRDNNPDASFCIFDTEEKLLELRRVGYDIAQAQKRIVAAGLPPFLAERLSLGR